MPFHVQGSHGHFSVDDEGMPITELPHDYRDIRRLDVSELRDWLKTLPKDFSEGPDFHIDILEVGYWYGDKKEYEPPDSYHRKHVEAGFSQVVLNDPFPTENT